MRELGDMAAGGAPVRPRPAATVVMVRDGAQGIEVFLVQRTRQARFMGGMYVFPGGALDPADGGPDYAALASGLDDARASAMLGIDRGGLAYWIAALRECFEESGFLFANEADGTPVRIEDAAARACYADARERMATGTLDLVGLCRARQLTLTPERLLYFSHWITPLGLPKRFDTRFFVAQVPSGQHGAADQRETIAHDWMRPSDALARAAAGEIELAFATVRTLEALAGFADCAGIMAHMREPAVIQAQQPRVARNGDARQVLLEGDHAFAEVGLLDPLGKGDASCVIVPGVATRLSARVRRIAAPNSGLMTGPGTNSYLIGEGDDLVVIDPGPRARGPRGCAGSRRAGTGACRAGYAYPSRPFAGCASVGGEDRRRADRHDSAGGRVSGPWFRTGPGRGARRQAGLWWRNPAGVAYPGPCVESCVLFAGRGRHAV
ncbi:8-oxo-dGTP pyrophosphatase MutT (NUDIX family) [Herbaspirillum rubrisubalbicans]|nr:8-oxo-dGTP pyrophosphatase MutT (NUDIX family) [Herbaspirillum rubrisubalbicans]